MPVPVNGRTRPNPAGHERQVGSSPLLERLLSRLVKPPQILRVRHRERPVEEIEYRSVEARRILRRDHVCRAREDGQLRFLNGVEHAERMLIADHIAVSGHHQCRRHDDGQIGQRYVWLLSQQIE